MTTSPNLIWQRLKVMRHNAAMRRALPLVLFSICLALVGCGHSQNNIHRRPVVYKKIISLSPGVTEIIATDGDVQAMKGRTQACNFPPNVVSIPVVAAIKPDYEKIAGIKPDLIVYDASLYNDQDVEKIKGLGATTYAIDAPTVDDFVKQLYELGSLLAAESRFNDYVNRIVDEEHNALAAPYSPKPTVAIVMPGEGGADMIAGTDGFLGDVVKVAGGTAVGPKGTQFVPMNPESLVSLNPNVIIVGGSKLDMSGVTHILNDPRFKTLSAVKNNRVRAIESDVLFRRGQRVDELLKAIHLTIGPDKK